MTDARDEDEGVLEESGESEVERSEEKVDASGKEAAGDPFRVEEDITGRVPVWKGVRDCNQIENAMSAFRPAWGQWVAEKIAQYPNNVALAKGYHNFRYRWENRTDTNGRSRCKGVCTGVTVYVDFA